MAELTVLDAPAVANSFAQPPALNTIPMPPAIEPVRESSTSAAGSPTAVVTEQAVFPSPFHERRASRRFSCEGKAEVIVLGGALRFQGNVRDLSATGCCMKTDVVFTLERGTQVEIVMMVNHVQFRVMGGVRSNHKVRGVGLEFMNVSARCARFIRDLIAELEAKQAAQTPAAQ